MPRTAASLAIAQEPQVGPLGEPTRLAVRGVKSAAPQEIAQALFADLDVVNAAFPTAPLAELKRLLVEKSIVGFQRSGFPHPRVTITDRLDHLELAVDEGPRWMAGEIRVVGAGHIDAGKLVAGLLPDDPKDVARAAAKESIWTIGSPAHLDKPAHARLARRVEQLLAEQGYPAAKVAVDVLGERGTAVLRVAIREESRPLTLGDMQLTRNKIHSREQILAYLQLLDEVVLSAEIREDFTPVSGAPSWDGKSAMNFAIRASTSMKKRRIRLRLIAVTQSASAALSIIRKHHARCKQPETAVRRGLLVR